MQRIPPNKPFSVPDGCPDELLEAFLDGHLDERTRLDVSAHLERCPRCRQELDSAQRVKDALRGLAIQHCPDSVVEEVLHVAQGEDERSIWQHSQRWLAAAALLLAAIALPIFLDHASDPEPSSGQRPDIDLSEQELRQAEQDVREALILFAQLTDRVGDIVEEQVLGERALRSTREPKQESQQ